MSLLAIAVYFVAGLVWWSLLEYLLHRFVFHFAPQTLGRRHIEHHQKPRERRLAVASFSTSIGGAALHAGVFIVLFGTFRGGWLLAGLITGYLAYEWVHYATHYKASRSRWMKALRKHHLLHHHAQSEARFGVTSPLWDWLFGTLPPAPLKGRRGASASPPSHLRGKAWGEAAR